MGGGNGRREEDRMREYAYQQQLQAQQQFLQSQKPDPLEELRRKDLMDWHNWRTGKSGPIDIRNAPDKLGIALFNDMKKQHDAARIGRGYGSLSDGGNPNFATALNKENEMERGLMASGMLENYITNKDADVDNSMLGYATMGNQRSQFGAGLARGLSQDAFDNYFNYRRSRRPSFLSQFLLAAAGGAAGPMTSWLTGGMGGGGGANTGGNWGAFSEGGSTRKYLGKPVIVGEGGREYIISEDGRKVQVVDQPTLGIVKEPSFVIPEDKLLAATRGYQDSSLRRSASPLIAPVASADLPRHFPTPEPVAANQPQPRAPLYLTASGELPRYNPTDATLQPPRAPVVKATGYEMRRAPSSGRPIPWNVPHGFEIEDLPRYNPASDSDSSLNPIATPSHPSSSALANNLTLDTGSKWREPAPAGLSSEYDPTGKDVAEIPVEQRLDALLAHAEQVDEQLATPPAREGAHADPASMRLARLEGLFDRLYDLETGKAEDQNGKLKSGLWNALYWGLQGLGAGGLGGGVGGAVAGLFTGMASPSEDERIKQQHQAAQLQGKLERLMGLESAQARIEHMRAQTAQQGKPDNAELMRELKNRLELTGGKLDERSKEIAARLNIAVAPQKSGSGRGYVLSPGQGVAFPNGAGGLRIIMPTDEVGNPALQMSPAQMAQIDAEQRRLELQLQQYNLSRSREGLSPVTFDDWLAAGAPTVESKPAPAPPGTYPAPPTDVSPSTTDTPSRPSLVPVPGGKPEPVKDRGGSGGRRRSGYGRRGGSSAGSSGGVSKEDSYTYGDASRTLREISDHVAAAAKHARRSSSPDDEAGRAAASELRAAKEKEEILKRDPRTRGKIDFTGEKDSQGRYWPSPHFKDETHKSHGSKKETVTRSQIREYAQRYNMTLRDAAREFLDEGFSVSGR